ncbi:MAG: hypothetical protein ACI83D_000794, partial [Planctomycetota bacterium]
MVTVLFLLDLIAAGFLVKENIAPREIYFSLLLVYVFGNVIAGAGVIYIYTRAD